MAKVDGYTYLCMWECIKDIQKDHFEFIIFSPSHMYMTDW